MTTTVVHKHHSIHDVNIARPTFWGNPYIIGRDGDRAQVVARYVPHFLQLVKDENGRRMALELKDQRLGCTCAPLLCHGHVIAAYLDDKALFDKIAKGGLSFMRQLERQMWEYTFVSRGP